MGLIKLIPSIFLQSKDSGNREAAIKVFKEGFAGDGLLNIHSFLIMIMNF